MPRRLCRDAWLEGRPIHDHNLIIPHDTFWRSAGRPKLVWSRMVRVSDNDNVMQGDFGETWLEVVAAAGGILHGPGGKPDLGEG